MYYAIQRRELHVYHHHNVPEPPSIVEGAAEGEEERVETVEMEFPSGYTDPWPDGTIEVSYWTRAYTFQHYYVVLIVFY